MTWANKTLHWMGKETPNIKDYQQVLSLQEFLLPFSSLTLLSLALFLWLVFIIRSRKASEKIKIPFVSNLPIPLPNFVNGLYILYRFQREGLTLAQELVSKYGSFFRIPLGLETIYFVADASIAQKILSSSSPTTLNKPRQIYEKLFVHEYRDGLLVLDYDIWSSHRKVITQSFSYNSLQTYLHFMNEHGRNLTEKLRSLCSSENGDSVEGKLFDDLIWSETIKIILETAMGSDCCTDEESAMIHNNFKRTKHIVQHRFQNPYLFLPPIWWFHPNRTEHNKNISTIQDFCMKKIQNFRRANSESGQSANECNGVSKETVHKCMIENMISAGASDKEVFAEIMTLVAAGHETTATAINMLLFQLACNPECQCLCRDEIFNVWRNGKNFSPKMSDVSELKYLERCILESLRLTPTVPVIGRRLDQSFEIDGEEKLTFEKGKTVIISPWVIHRDSNIYPNPEKFDPDRFLPENVQKRHPYAYLPFSGGPRNCIGYKYAILEIKVIVAWLLYHFDVFASDDPKTVRYFMEVTLITDRDLNIIFKKR